MAFQAADTEEHTAPLQNWRYTFDDTYTSYVCMDGAYSSWYLSEETGLEFLAVDRVDLAFSRGHETVRPVRSFNYARQRAIRFSHVGLIGTIRRSVRVSADSFSIDRPGSTGIPVACHSFLRR